MQSTSISYPIPIASDTQGHLTALAVLYYGSLSEQYDDLIRKFVQTAPWSAWPALTWRNPSANSRYTTETSVAEITLSTDTHEIMHDMITQINRINRLTVDYLETTPQIFLYTAVHWWTTHVYPKTPHPSYLSLAK